MILIFFLHLKSYPLLNSLARFPSFLNCVMCKRASVKIPQEAESRSSMCPSCPLPGSVSKELGSPGRKALRAMLASVQFLTTRTGPRNQARCQSVEEGVEGMGMMCVGI